MTDVPSFLEDHISQIPALHLLQNLGYGYLRPDEALAERNGKRANVLLEGILYRQLKLLNRFTFKNREHEFSDANVQEAVQALRNIPFDGLVRTSEQAYDLISLGKSFQETIDGDTKSFTIRYIDWERPENNVFHVTAEFDVERTASYQTCRPDIVLFVNGIPFVVIECKGPGSKEPVEQAIGQQRRNQEDDYIPRLFVYAQIVLALATNDAAFGTTGTKKEFWARWREPKNIDEEISRYVNQPLAPTDRARMFSSPFETAKAYFDELEAAGDRAVTEQDRTLYALCRPERLLELSRQFILYDQGEKKIARYQQYFAVKNTMVRVLQTDEEGNRQGGVIWHTQGSGKSLTMVMLAKAIALERSITDPKIILVTDRVDLDDQIYNTFRQCGKEPVKARNGKHLLELLGGRKETIITTLIDKFESAVRTQGYTDPARDIFVLVDESHRSQYGSAHTKMRKTLRNACYIGFTGTPLMKAEKNTVNKFGGFIDRYTIDQAVRDKAVVPLLYEGRHIWQEVDQLPLDKWFEVATTQLSEKQKAELKRKFASPSQLNKTERKIHLTAYDIEKHFVDNVTPGMKAQLAADSKASALLFKEYLDEFGKVSSEVLISAPEEYEGDTDTVDNRLERVRLFWKRMMDRYGNEKAYNKQVINAFKHGEDPKIIIVVDKLLTGFDAPRNTVLYLARRLKEHGLLQAIARVNRLFPSKDFGYVIDYYGVLKQLGEALDLYGSFSEFDSADIANTLVDVSQQVAELPQKYSELKDIFKTIANPLDEEAYELLLADEQVRERFYDKLSAYNRALAIAFSSVRFVRETSQEWLDRYKAELVFFQKLRVSVKRRYADGLDHREYEAKVQKLLNTHVTATEVIEVTPLVNIFDQEKFQAEIARLKNPVAKADTIVHRTQKAITEKMEDDPVFYRRFSEILKKVIEEYRLERLSANEYLKQVSEIMNAICHRTGDDLPPELVNRDTAKAFYGMVKEVLDKKEELPSNRDAAAAIALGLDDIVLRNRVVDWVKNVDVQNTMRNEMDDYLYEVKDTVGVELSFDDLDLIIEGVLDIAKKRLVA